MHQKVVLLIFTRAWQELALFDWHQLQAFFAYTVDLEATPHYKEITARPMDLSTVKYACKAQLSLYCLQPCSLHQMPLTCYAPLDLFAMQRCTVLLVMWCHPTPFIQDCIRASLFKVMSQTEKRITVLMRRSLQAEVSSRLLLRR